MARIRNDIEIQEKTEKTARLLIHEIMNPVSSMSLSVETLKLADPENEKLDILEQSLDKLIQFVKEYANAVRKPSINKNELQISQVLEVCLKESSKNINLRNTSVDLRKPEEDLRINGDKKMLQEAFFHLILNSLEASGFEGGKIHLSSGRENGYTFIRIEDHGDGISDEDLPFIFDPLFTTKNGHQGLGLTRANSILCAHNATLDIESDSGNGTRTEVRFTHQ